LFRFDILFIPCPVSAELSFAQEMVSGRKQEVTV